MTDALANQIGKQPVQRLQLDWRRITPLNIGRKALDDVRARQVLGHQIRFAAQPAKTCFQQRQRLGRSNAQKRQAVALAPRMPGPARTPKTLEPVGETFDVVALDHQRAARHFNLADTRCTTGFIKVSLIEQGIGPGQYRQHRCLLVAANGAQGKSPALHAEQGAVPTDLGQKVVQPPGTDFLDLLEQRFHRQGVLAIAEQIMHQQFFDKRLKVFRQLGEEHAQVFQHFLSGQRLACLFDANTRTVDQIQLAVLTQQVVQVQVFLPEPLEVHLPDRAQRLCQYVLLLICQDRQTLHRFPGHIQALGVFQKLEQQPAALAFLQTVGQQQGRGQPLLGQQTHAIELALKIARSFRAHHQLGQHRTPAPDTGADIALARQHAQQCQQLQPGGPGGVLQLNA